MAAGTGTGVVQRAAAYARDAHAGDVRKGTGRPYFDGHLEPVAAIVRRAGGTDAQVAAAYLHDVAEDHGGHRRLDDVRRQFGEEIATIVADLSDSLVDTEAGEHKAPWHERKTAYVLALASKPRASLEVAAADKLHNVTSMLEDLDRFGDELWSRFSTSDPADHLWYYETLSSTIRRGLGDHPTALALTAAVERLAGAVSGRDVEQEI